MRFKIYIPFLLLLFLFSSCKKNGPEHKVYVYSTQPLDYSVTKLQLYVQDTYKGEIPYINERLWFGDDSLESKALIFTLEPDKYSVIAKDQLGNSKSEGEMKLRRNSASATSVIGTIHARAKGNNVILEISRN